MGVFDGFRRLPRRLTRRARERLAPNSQAAAASPASAGDSAPPESARKAEGPLFFMHITKTAGGSLKAVLEEELGPERATFCNQRFLRDEVDRETLLRSQVLFGHFMFGVHDWYDLPPRYACFLRDPVARVVSHFYHLRDVDERHNGDFVRKFGDLDTFVARSQHWELDNFLCRVLTGNGKRQLAFGGVDETVFQTAMDNLEKHFEFIGLFEEMDESLDLLRDHLGLARAALPEVNKGRYDRDALSPETLDHLHELNTYDRRLRAAFDRPVLRPRGVVDRAA